jgi:ethanolamine utilization protein EutQ (cupin superfamily)
MILGFAHISLNKQMYKSQMKFVDVAQVKQFLSSGGGKNPCIIVWDLF